MPITGDAPLTVRFTDRSDPAEEITYWLWEFGDGDPDYSGQTPPDHLYAAPGAYTVTLHVASPKGLGARSDTVTVEEAPELIAAWSFEDGALPATDSVDGAQLTARSAGQELVADGAVGAAAENTDDTVTGGLVAGAADVVPAAGPYSFSLWVKFAAVRALDAIIFENAASVVASECRYMLRVNATADGLEYRVSDTGTFSTEIGILFDIDTSLWYWLAVTEASDGTVKFYVRAENGSVDDVVSSGPGGTHPATIAASSLHVFCAEAYVASLAGKVDELRFWDRELTAAQLEREFARETV